MTMAACHAMPQFVLRNGGNKCFKVDVTSDMVLIVQYEAPDLVQREDNKDERRGADGNEDNNADADRYRRPIKVRQKG